MMTTETDDTQPVTDALADETLPTVEELLAQREAEAADLKDRLVRALAETENVRRRLEKDKQDASVYAVTSFARDLLAVADNLRRAIDAVPETARDNDTIKGLVVGVEMTERELQQVFARFGITKMEALGARLDPHLHQAMAEIDNSEHPPGHIAQVYQSGYVIKDRLLRPAMVVVAKAAADASSPRVDTTA
jgi:molecular chaperone GrpE